MVERPSARSVARRGPIGSIGGFLERFQRSGGVPAAVGEETALELVPVFAALDAFELEAAELQRHAEQVAAHRLHEAEEGAKEIMAGARGLADSERDDALKAGLRAADVEASQIVARADVEGRRIEEVGRARLTSLVDEVLARVLEAP